MSFPPANTNGSAAPTAAAGVRCVLVHPRGQAVPGDLLTSLSRRVKQISVCSDAYTAMAEICTATERTAAIPSLILLLVQPEQIPDAGELLGAIPTYAPDLVCWKFDARANPKLIACVETTGPASMARGEAAAGVERPAGRSPSVDSMKDRRCSPSGEQSEQDSFPRQPRLAPASSPAVAPVAPSAPSTNLQPVVRVAASRPPAAPTAGNGTRRSATPPSPGAGEGPGRMLLTPEELRMLLGDDPSEPRT